MHRTRPPPRRLLALAALALALALCAQPAAANYLHTPRLHFAGSFYCEVGTLNNFVNNYDPANPTIPWWDPTGLNIFRLSSDVEVTAAVPSPSAAGAAAAGAPAEPDCAVSARLSTGRSGKMVDLDPDQQFQSQLFGVSFALRVAGARVFAAQLEPSEMQGQWMRAVTTFAPPTMLGNTTQMRAAYWQAVLTDVRWDAPPPACSPTLTALYETSRDTLSIRLNLDNYDNRNFSSTFRIGRAVGALGPYLGDARQHISGGRQVVPLDASGRYNSAQFFVDPAAAALTIDLGNSVRVREPGGESLQPALFAAIATAPGQYSALRDGLADTSRAAYLTSGNIATLPLDPSELALLQAHPLALFDGDGALALCEDERGFYAFFDRLTSRLEKDEAHAFLLNVYSFGRPASGVRIPLGFRPSPMPRRADRINNVPADGVSFPDHVVTDDQGSAEVLVRAGLLGDVLPPPRTYIDSQVYFVGNASDSPLETGAVSLLVFNHHPPPTMPVTWSEAFRFFDLWGRLFPTMNYIVNLTDETAVRRSASSIQRTLDLDHLDAGYMPVTRDLSLYQYQVMTGFLNSDDAS